MQYEEKINPTNENEIKEDKVVDVPVRVPVRVPTVDKRLMLGLTAIILLCITLVFVVGYYAGHQSGFSKGILAEKATYGVLPGMVAGKTIPTLSDVNVSGESIVKELEGV